MKKILLFVALLVSAIAAKAAIATTTAITCSFEASEGWDGSFATGWSTELVSWGSEVFQLCTTDAHSGSQCLCLTSGDWDSEDAYLNLPTYDFGAEEVQVTVSFWAKSIDGASVYFGEDEVELEGSDWAQYSYTLTLSGEQSIQFDGYAEYGAILYLDDITVTYEGTASVEPEPEPEPVYLTLPYNEGFESGVSASLPEGWTAITDQTWNLERKSTGTPHDGSFYLAFIGGSDAKYAVLPAYEGNLAELSIALWQKTRDFYACGQLTVGAMSNPADAATFTAIATLPKTASAQQVSGEYQQAVVNLAGAPADCHYIALRYQGGTGSSDDMLYLDDILVCATADLPHEGAATFEAFTVGENGVFYDPALVSDQANYWYDGAFNMATYFSNAWGAYYSDIVVSALHDTTLVADYMNPVSYLSAAVSHAAEGNQYAVWNQNYYGIAPVQLAAPAVVSGMAVTNTSAVINYIFDQYTAFGQNAWFALTVEGKRNGATTGTVTCFLVDFRDATTWKYAQQWQWLDLTSLGEVDELLFNVDGSDKNEYGLLSPAYFCFDNLGGQASECQLGAMTEMAAPAPETALDNAELQHATKIIRDGQILIIRGEHIYNAAGQLIR